MSMNVHSKNFNKECSICAACHEKISKNSRKWKSYVLNSNFFFKKALSVVLLNSGQRLQQSSNRLIYKTRQLKNCRKPLWWLQPHPPQLGQSHEICIPQFPVWDSSRQVWREHSRLHSLILVYVCSESIWELREILKATGFPWNHEGGSQRRAAWSKRLWLRHMTDYLMPGRKSWGERFLGKLEHSKSPIYLGNLEDHINIQGKSLLKITFEDTSFTIWDSP